MIEIRVTCTYTHTHTHTYTLDHSLSYTLAHTDTRANLLTLITHTHQTHRKRKSKRLLSVYNWNIVGIPELRVYMYSWYPKDVYLCIFWVLRDEVGAHHRHPRKKERNMYVCVFIRHCQVWVKCVCVWVCVCVYVCVCMSVSRGPPTSWTWASQTSSKNSAITSPSATSKRYRSAATTRRCACVRVCVCAGVYCTCVHDTGCIIV